MQALWTCPKLRVGVAGEEPMGPDGLVHPAGRLLAQPHSTCSVRQEFLFFSLKKKTIYLFLPVLGLHCYTWAFFSCGKQGLFFVVVCRLLTVVASLVEHGLSSTGSVVVGYGLSCSMACGIFPD